MLSLERVAPRPHPEGEQVGADITDSDGLAQVVLHDGHLLGRALGAQQPATVTAVVTSGRQSKLGLKIWKIFGNFSENI